MNNTKSLLESALPFIISYMTRWAERKFGLLAAPALGEAKINFGRYPENARDAHISVPMNFHTSKLLDFFLHELELRFTVSGVRDWPKDTTRHDFEPKKDIPNQLHIWSVGIYFEGKNGGTNGWTCETTFYWKKEEGGISITQMNGDWDMAVEMRKHEIERELRMKSRKS